MEAWSRVIRRDLPESHEISACVLLVPGGAHKDEVWELGTRRNQLVPGSAAIRVIMGCLSRARGTFGSLGLTMWAKFELIPKSFKDCP